MVGWYDSHFKTYITALTDLIKIDFIVINYLTVISIVPPKTCQKKKCPSRLKSNMHNTYPSASKKNDEQQELVEELEHPPPQLVFPPPQLFPSIQPCVLIDFPHLPNVVLPSAVPAAWRQMNLRTYWRSWSLHHHHSLSLIQEASHLYVVPLPPHPPPTPAGAQWPILVVQLSWKVFRRVLLKGGCSQVSLS